jgi:BirA family biotin operon repressor/biotin-[acetyl-CoA-carboxylase] ligase
MNDGLRDRLDRDSLAQFPFARTVSHRWQVDSTNALARSLLIQNCGELPLLVWAETQTLGKGQRNSQWWSDEGSLTFTVAVDPLAHRLRMDQEPRLSLAMAVAVIKAIDALNWVNPGIGIRWPNDIEASDRKLGGILPELLETNQGHRVLIGVGLNVLTCLDRAPEEIRSMATTLASFQAAPLEPDSLRRLLEGIMRQFDQEVQKLAVDSPGQVLEWDRLNLLHGRVVRVNLGCRIITGRVEAIDAQGALCLVDQDTSQIHRLFGGQVLRDATALPVHSIAPAQR